jgi:hypothetical protein
MNGVLWYIGRRRPLLFFGVPGVLGLLVGLVWGVRVVSVVLEKHVMPVGHGLISASLCIAGTMALFAGIILNTVGKLEEQVLDRLEAAEGVQTLGRLEAAEGVQTPAQASTSPSSGWPLLLLGIPGMLALLAGLALGAWTVSLRYQSGGHLYGSLVASVSLCIAGLMTWFTGIILHALHEILAHMSRA